MPFTKDGELTKSTHTVTLTPADTTRIRSIAEKAVRSFELDLPEETIADGGNYYLRVEVGWRSFGATARNLSTATRAGKQFVVLLQDLNAHLPQTFHLN